MTPAREFAFEAQGKVGAALEIGAGPDGARRMIPITGGTVSGPALHGVVLAGGADWQRIRPDGTTELEARYTIRTAEGSLIAVVNRGFRHGPAEVMKRLAEGRAVDPTAYYFRTTPVFHTATGPYAWMTRTVFVASGERWPDRVTVRFWALR